MPRFHSCCLPFQSEDNYAFVNTAGAMGRRQTENSCCFETAFGRKSSTFWKWHCLRKIAVESKRLIHTWWTWCQITFNRIFYPIQQKSMVFNQESRWNNGSKSLHSFWATLYIYLKYEIMKAILNTKANIKKISKKYFDFSPLLTSKTEET